MTLAEAAAAINSGLISPVELTEALLARIEAVDGRVGALATLAPDALRQAQQATEDMAAGVHSGPLRGIPFVYKDLIDVAGLPTLAGSKVPARPVPQRDSTVAARLRAAGVIALAKAHTHEFAAGVTTPPTRNPWALDRVPGGSSGGSAAAVAARECPAAIGTDTGGSIRIPAALCGVVGLKPTYDLVPRSGITPLSWSLDHAGPITRTVRDAALVLSQIANGAADYTQGLDGGVPGLRIGVLSPRSVGAVHPDIAARVGHVVDELADLGARPTEVDLPEPQATAATSWTLTFIEAATFHRPRFEEYAEQYGQDVRTLLEVGQLLPATRYVTALRARNALKAVWRGAFKDIDVIICPTVPCEPTLVGEDAVIWPDESVEAVADAFSRLTLGANVIGLPALTLPVGLTGRGLPVGLQLLARPYAEATLLRAATACEQIASFDDRPVLGRRAA